MSLCFTALVLVGCAGTAFRSSFRQFNSVYADNQNVQMLLNLARLSEHHPSYFLQIGTISATYQFSSSAGLSDSTTEFKIPNGTDNFTYGGNLSASGSEQPTFSYTPLSGSQFSDAIFRPMDPSILFALYDQGYPVDQLFRLMVQSIDFYNPKDGKRHTFFNTPTARNPKNYNDFLTLCGVALELQRKGLLRIEQKTTMVTVPGPTFANPTVEEVLKASEKGLSFKKNDDGTFSLQQAVTSSGFQFDPKTSQFMDELSKKDSSFELSDAGVVTTGQKGNSGFVLKLRPFVGVLHAAATEAAEYDKMVSQDPKFLPTIPPSEREPILRIRWDNNDGVLERPLVTTSYDGKTFSITDSETPANLRPTFNREVFILINYLFTQVSLDPSKLPVQQIIQVR